MFPYHPFHDTKDSLSSYSSSSVFLYAYVSLFFSWHHQILGILVLFLASVLFAYPSASTQDTFKSFCRMTSPGEINYSPQGDCFEDPGWKTSSTAGLLILRITHRREKWIPYAAIQLSWIDSAQISIQTTWT